MKKILGFLLALGMVASVTAANRVGPVSQYGQLVTGKNANGHGRIYGACNPTPGHEVSVRGMSLYWSVHSGGTQFYSETAINKMVSDMKIEIIRIPVGTSENCWSGDCDDGYISDPDAQKALVKKVVDAAVNNDIYVIIDWHSHTANNQVDKAKEFFSYMAQTYGDLDNVIFEIFNEPENQSWDQVKNYANVIIPEIRKYSDNLILVGSPKWDQHPEYAISAPVTDSKNNTAYTFHYYAGSHKTNSEGANAVSAMNAGLSVFVSEWGTGSADGGGNPADYGNANKTWQDWLDTYQLSAANWSASRIDEGTAAFKTSSTASNFYYTASGDTVKKYLSKNPSSYTVCKDPASSGSGWSSSSTETSSSSIAGATSVIDDFEDGNGIANTGLDDVWYAFTDVNDKGTSTISNTKNTDGYVVVSASAAAKSSKFGAGLTGIVLKKGSNAYAPYVSLGVNINDGLAGCKTLTYDYKGAGHNLKAITSGDEKGALSEYNYHKKALDSSSFWKTASVPVGDLTQESGWGKSFELFAANVVQLQWEVKGNNAGTQQPDYNYLYIDNLACDGMSFVPVVIPDEESSSSGGGTSSSSGKSSSSISGTSSSSVGGTSSSSVGGSSASTGAPGVIDDVEDGDGQAFSGGYWFAYTDKGDKGASIIGNDTDADDGYVMVADGSNGTNYVVGMNGIQLNKGGNENDPYVAMGLNLTIENMASNLSTCTEISYDYKGAAHNFKVVMAGDPKGELTGYDRHFKLEPTSTSWTKATISWSDLKQNGWGKSVTLDKTKVSAFHWEVKGSASVNYLYVDNFTCVGLNVSDIALSSSSAKENSSSSAYNPYNPYSSSSYNPYNPYSSSAYNPYNPYDPYGIAETQLHSGLKVSMAGSVLNVTVERAGLVKVHVFDMMGHAIESHVENMAAGTYGHSLANLSKGAYIVRVQQGSEQKVIRTQVR